MGWSATNTKEVNKKKAVEKEILYGSKIVKSVMKGNIYYGAIKDGEEIFAVVIPVKTTVKNYFNLTYRIIHESEGPIYHDCPESILNVLTPTDSEWANEWRKKCREYLKKKKQFENIKFGQKVEITLNGEKMILIKHPPAYQFKKWFWMKEDNHTYINKKYVTPENAKIIA